MEYCEFCEVEIESDNHSDLHTCMVNELSYLKIERVNKVGDTMTQRKREERISNLKSLLKEDFECVETGKEFDTLEEILEHERSTFGVRVINREEETCKSITCTDCGKKFYDRGQKMPVKYLLNRHKKKCASMQVKNIKASLKTFITECQDLNTLKQLLSITNINE